MYAMNVIAASALLSVVAAVPMAKRDIVWFTETQVDVVTVPVTQTVWVDSTGASSHYGHNVHPTFTSHILSTVTVSSSPVESSSSTESPSTYVAPSSYETPTTSSTPVSVAPTTSSASVYVAPTTSSASVYVAPTTSSASIYVAPTTSSTSVYVTSTTSTSSAAAATSSSASSQSSGLGASGTSYTGDLTWYADGLGACGWTNTASDHIVAISHIIFDSYNDNGNPNNNPMCGQTVTITGVDGSAYTAEVVDRCTGCAEGDLDLSEDYFNTVTDNGNGRVPGISWKFN